MYKVPYHTCLLQPLIVNSTLDMNGSKADILQLIHHINGLLSANKRPLSAIDTKSNYHRYYMISAIFLQIKESQFLLHFLASV